MQDTWTVVEFFDGEYKFYEEAFHDDTIDNFLREDSAGKVLTADD